MNYARSDYHILQKLCSEFNISVSTVRKRSKGRIANIRNVIQWTLRYVAGWTWQRIANIFRRRSHTTVVKNVKKFEGWVESDLSFRKWFEGMLRKIVAFFRD